MIPTVIPALGAVLVTAFVHILISRGYQRRAIQEHDKRFSEVREDQGKQWAAINEHGEAIAALDARKCPLAGCPMQLTAKGAASF